MKLAWLKRSLLKLFDEIFYNFMLEERYVDSPCKHQWKKIWLDCGIEGYYCPTCRKQTLP